MSATRASAKRRRTYQAIDALTRVSQLVERRRRQLGRAAGLSDRQWSALEEIGRSDFLPSLFARGSRTSPAAVSRTLRQLLERGLVEVGISGRDGRQREYTLTPEGRRLLDELAGQREQALSAVWDAFPAAEIEQFERFARQLADRLEAYAEAVEAD